MGFQNTRWKLGINISQLMVYDSKGNIVESISPSFDSDSQLNTAKKMVIDITDKPAGIYMFSAYAGKDIVLSGKLVKDKNGPL